MYNEICSLIPTASQTVNSYGDTISSEGTPRQVFCRVKSYSLKDKYSVGVDGEVPELTIVLADKSEYSQELSVLYNNIRYKVIHVAFDDMHNDIGLVVSRWQQQ